MNPVPEWQPEGLIRGFRGDALPVGAHAKVAACYVEDFCEAGLSREFVSVVWARYKVNDTDSKGATSLVEQRTCDAAMEVDNEENNWNFEGIVTVEELASSGIHGKLQ